MNKVQKLLETKSIRVTPMRQILLAHFLEQKKAFGLLDLEQAFPRSDRTTIYRTLKTFVDKGILHDIQSGTSELKYALCKEYCSPEHHFDRHPHFYCTECAKTECLESILIPEMNLPKGYQGQEFSMTIKGICPDCQS